MPTKTVKNIIMIDKPLFVATMILLVLGLIMSYSLSSYVVVKYNYTDMHFFIRQLIAVIIGTSLMIWLSKLDPDKWFKPIGMLLFLSFLIILLMMPLLPESLFKSVGGSKRWIEFGPFSMQPSEIMKIALIIILASIYSGMVSEKGLNYKKLVRPALICIVPFLLIAVQPDLGTAMLLLLIAGSITLFVKVERRVMLSCIGLCIAAIPLGWIFLLKGYQKSRVLTLFNPERDPLGAGYHIIQSKIAIGSGMLSGKGFLQGTQNTLSFLPEQHTDFILSVLAEEWGFIGCFVLLFLYFILLLWGLNISYGCRNMFGAILAFGITCMIFWQIFINFGMVMGLMPVVGVPLPLISYGGSSVITNMIGFGILLNISMRKYISN